MNKLVEEAPYHPGYEDAVVKPNSVYRGVDPTKMLWKPKPLSDEKIWALSEEFIREKENILLFARAIEKAHGIK